MFTLKNFAIVLIRAEEKHYVLINPDNSLAWYPSVAEGIKTYEDRYNRKHAVSYEGSMSACINYLFFQPALVFVKDLDDVRQKVFAGQKDEDLRIHHVSNISGGFRGLLCGPEAAKVWDDAAHPQLITEDFDRIKKEVGSR